MNFKIKLLTTFLITFLTGCFAFFMVIGRTSDSIETTERNVKIVKTETPPRIETPELKSEPFNPEISGLKDFSDTNDFKELFKFVDVINHRSIYRSDEVIAKNKQIWLGLFKDNEKFYLKKTRVQIVPDRESSYEDEKYVFIKFKEKSTPIFILENTTQFEEGNIETLFNAKSSEDDYSEDDSNKMHRGFVKEFRLGEKTYTLKIKDALTKSGDNALALVLGDGKINQVVTYGAYYDNDYLGNLLWVGDLDGDKKLDLYMNFNDWEKGYFNSSLFISSDAEKGKLVKEVAGFWTAGC